LCTFSILFRYGFSCCGSIVAAVIVPGAYYFYSLCKSYDLLGILLPAPFPLPDELKNHISISVEQIKQAREDEVRKKVNDKTIAFNGENILSSLLTRMDGNNDHSGKTRDIAYRQADVFKKELENNFDQEDLQNIALASLVKEVNVEEIFSNDAVAR
jgi:hypothetical protein